MKKAIIMYFLYINLTSIAQEVHLFKHCDDILYVNTINYLQLFIDNGKYEDVNFETDNGTILKEDRLVNVIPNEIGYCRINVLNVKGDVINRIVYNVKDFPKPTPYLNSNVKESISKKIYLANANKIALLFEPYSIDVDYELCYNVIIIRNEKVIYNRLFKDKLFPMELREQLRGLHVEDVIVFYDIKIILKNHNNDINIDLNNIV